MRSSSIRMHCFPPMWAVRSVASDAFQRHNVPHYSTARAGLRSCWMLWMLRKTSKGQACMVAIPSQCKAEACEEHAGPSTLHVHLPGSHCPRPGPAPWRRRIHRRASSASSGRARGRGCKPGTPGGAPGCMRMRRRGGRCKTQPPTPKRGDVPPGARNGSGWW